MGFWRRDNDKRSTRVNNLGQTTADDHLRLEVIIKETDKIRSRLNIALQGIATEAQIKIDDFIPAVWPPNWIPIGGSKFEKGVARTYVTWTGVTLLSIGGGTIGWRLSAPLTRAVTAAIYQHAAMQLIGNLAPNQAFHFTPAQIQAAAHALPVGTQIRIAGWRGVLRYAARGIASAGAAAAVGVVVDLLFQLYYDEKDYAELSQAIVTGVEARFTARLALKRAERLKDAFGEIAAKAEILHEQLKEKRLAKFDLKEDFTEPALKILGKKSDADTVDEVVKELEAADKGAYTDGTPPLSTYKDRIVKEVEDRYKLVKIKKIRVWSGTVVDAIQVEDAAGRVQEKWGGGGGAKEEIVLADDEKISSVSWQPRKHVSNGKSYAAVGGLLIKTNKRPLGYGPFGSDYQGIPSGTPTMFEGLFTMDTVEVNTPDNWEVTGLVGQDETTASFDDKGQLLGTEVPVVDNIFVVGAPAQMLSPAA
jgi:hypothetical protein